MQRGRSSPAPLNVCSASSFADGKSTVPTRVYRSLRGAAPSGAPSVGGLGGAVRASLASPRRVGEWGRLAGNGGGGGLAHAAGGYGKTAILRQTSCTMISGLPRAGPTVRGLGAIENAVPMRRGDQDKSAAGRGI